MPETANPGVPGTWRPIALSGEEIGSFETASRLEWLETNGLGGWASGTVSGANTRRYHGVLVAATAPPLGRVVLLSKLDETVQLKALTVPLGANRFPDVVDPEGYQHLISFERGIFPIFRYRIGSAVLEKTVVAIHGENTTLLRYRLTGSTVPGMLRLRPLIAGRDIHGLRRATDQTPSFGFVADTLTTEPLALGARLFLTVPGASLRRAPEWWNRFAYDVERDRGFDWQEDLWTPGEIEVRLEPERVLHVLVSTDDPTGRDLGALHAREATRRAALIDQLPIRDHVTVPLALAADQFLVERGDDRRTVIAGYHWFADWGRDTMIALPGLTLPTGRPDDARRILQTFAGLFDQGMLPNRFPDDGHPPEYNCVDAALWYFVALHAFWKSTNDDALVRELLPALREAVRWHIEGTRHGIVVDDDGLLRAGESGVQLTWMDAKLGDWVVTPRIGKPVEINALWINVLAILAEMETTLGDPTVGRAWTKETARGRKAFGAQFWHPDGGYLYDVVDGERRDASLRPNQIIALALPHPLLAPAKRRSVLRVVEQHLLTPVGLRSLAPGDPSYRSRYDGDARGRDSAYHQGTVWPWLLGPFVTALVRERGAKGRVQGRALIEGCLLHLRQAGVGTISEIFDADAEHIPRGAIAQAWSVAEILRAWLLTATPHPLSTSSV
ncbi:MAG: glycogen debranching enzyme family protein [Gemmatimonadetes bacterium]|nr:glycogen debranching enzyme family protein [Gemmatimonadota bacterium]